MYKDVGRYQKPNILRSRERNKHSNKQFSDKRELFKEKQGWKGRIEIRFK